MSIDVAVNLLWCVPHHVGGSEEYVTRQLAGLTNVADDVHPHAFVLPGFADAHPDLAELMPMTTAPVKGRRRWARVGAEATWLRRKTNGFDLVHHGGGTAPLAPRRPYLLTIHDLQYRVFPQYFHPVKRTYLQRTLPRSVGGAAAVAVPTEYVRQTVIEAFDYPAERIAVVPSGFSPPAMRAVTSEADLRAKFQLGDGPVLVYPAVTHPHKNHRFLLSLLGSHWVDPDVRLVLTGGSGAAEGDVTQCTDRRVRRVGRVSDADRDGLLAMATAMVFPSEYEGFGAPLIEAMAFGTPVIASDAACIPEVLADAGQVCPLVPQAWSDALDAAISDAAEFATRGRSRAAQFTIDRSGRELAAAYRLAVEHGRR